MAQDDLPAFAELRRRYSQLDDFAEGNSTPPVVSLNHAVSTGDDPLRVLRYLRGLGVAVTNLDDLHAGINGLHDEEELAAFRCREGVAVVIASDGAWALFTDGAVP